VQNRTSRHNTIRPIGMQQTPRTQFPAEGSVAPVALALGALVTCLAGSRTDVALEGRWCQRRLLRRRSSPVPVWSQNESFKEHTEW